MKKVYYALTSLIITGIVLLVLQSGVYAAGATISASSTNVEKGTSVTINVSISSAASWALDTSTTGGTLTKSDDRVGNTNSGNNESQTVKLGTFVANTAGTYTITLSGYVVDGTDLTKKNVSGTVKVTVTDPTPTPDPEPDPEPTPDPEPDTPVVVTKSSNANLKNLGIRPNDFSGFKSGTTTYNVTVPNNVSSVEVYAVKDDEKAAITSGTGTKNLNVGNNALSVVVTAEDGTKKTYTINVTREEEKPEENKSNNAKLRSMTVTPEGLTPEFNMDVNEYTLEVANEVNEIVITATKDDSKSNYEVIGNNDLKEGENVVKVEVTAEDGTKNTYQIKVTKKSQDSIVLKTLSLQGINEDDEKMTIKLTPEFNSEVTEYKATVKNFIKELQVDALANFNDVKMDITGNKDLKEGENVITIIVKSADEKESKTYQITLENPTIGEVQEEKQDITEQKKDLKVVIFIVCISLIAIIAVVYIAIEIKNKRNNKEEDMEIDLMDSLSNNNDSKDNKKGGRHF